MHNVSKKTIRELAKAIAQTDDAVYTSDLLEKARELYEKTTLLHYIKPVEQEKEVLIKPEHNLQESVQDEKELSIQERIQQIMNNAPKFEPKTPVNTPENKVEPEKIEQAETAQEKQITTPTKNLEEEFQDAIAADYAADLFEKADKIEITKKSLNDKLSQEQIQIGLNDRIAFVKHLFNGNQSDFNRVLSQLNSFQSQEQASHFIEKMVKPDYNWNDKDEYVSRFMLLIERKFL